MIMRNVDAVLFIQWCDQYYFSLFGVQGRGIYVQVFFANDE